MKEWKNPILIDLGLEDTKSCNIHGLTKDNKSESSDSSKDGASSCSSSCPFDEES